MPRTSEPSYTDLVHEVVKESPEPLPVATILERVGERRMITTKKPEATVRNALTQSHLLASTGDGRYGWVPRLVSGSLLRVLLSEKRPANSPLLLPDEVLGALWPDFFEPDKRKLDRVVVLRLPSGAEAPLARTFLRPGGWGSPMPDALRAYLIEHRASAGDSLLIRIVDGERGVCDGWCESRLKRDDAAITRRDREIAESALRVWPRTRRATAMIWELTASLLARGAYRTEPAPDPLERVLAADSRFVSSAYGLWALADRVAAEDLSEMGEIGRTLSELAQLRGSPDPLRSRLGMERMLADIGALVEGREFSSAGEANSLAQEILGGGGAPRRRATKPLEQAQDLMYDAWEASSERERVRLARKALEISPDCADAYVLLAEETARGPREAADLYARGVSAGERALGPRFFEHEKGHFWGLLETRPYMRARHGLAQALWALGRHKEAIEHAQAMLDLNPGDNQGIRYLLLDWLLELGDDPSVASLLERYADDGMAEWAFGAALHAFRTAGDTPHSRDLLREANETNPHVAGYLLGKKRLPRQMPDLIGFGDENEAVDCAAGQLSAWRRAPGALDWLRRQTRQY